MTRLQVIQLGLLTLLLGAIAFWGFRFLGFEGASAGIASEAFLVVVVIAWTGSYLFRVVTGKMTFIEQRKRYRKAYEELTNEELQSRFDSMSEHEQIRLIEEVEADKKTLQAPSDL